MQLIILLISVLLFACYAVLLMYYRYAWKSIPAFKAANVATLSTTISVIIPARNEAANIINCLQSIKSQTYPVHLLNVFVIDDHSTDNTASLVRSCNMPNVQLISLSEFISAVPINSYKKKAIETGIAQSSATLIVTTDADCNFPDNWLQTIAAFYETHQPAFIAAPVVIDSNKSFIEIFQSLDFLSLQGITGASVQKNLHSMCNGANLAYERSAFIEIDGFKGIDGIASGDDMLLMHKIYKRYPDRVKFLLSKDAIVKTEAVKNIRSFFNQRIRWASKADKYDDKRILAVLIAVYFFNVVLVLLPSMAIYSNRSFSFFETRFSILQAWLLLLVLKTCIELFFLFPVASFFGKKKLLWLFPFMQPFHIIYTITAGWLGKFGSYQWKERKVK